MNPPPCIVDEVEFELDQEEDLPIIEGVLDDPETKRLDVMAEAYEQLAKRLDADFCRGMAPCLPVDSPRSASFKVWAAEGEVLKAQVALEDALKALAEARKVLVLATTPPSIKPVI